MSRKKKEHPIEMVTPFMALVSLMVYLKTMNFQYALGAFLLGTFIGIFVIVNISLDKKKKNQKKLFDSGINIVDVMSGLEFEEFILVHFKNQGYKGEVTQATNDYGADLILNKDELRIVVQAKRWKEKIGITAVQEIVGAINYYGASKGMVVTNSYFTSNAVELAKVNNIELWDRDKLIEIMSQNQDKHIIQDTKNEKTDIVSEIEMASGLCPKCNSELVARNGKRGTFIGCIAFPKCRFTKDY